MPIITGGGVDTMFYHFKWCHSFLNGLALLVMASGIVAGAVWVNSFMVVGLRAFGTVVKGSNDFKKFFFKVDASIYLHHLQKDVDRIENVCARFTSGKIQQIPDQDAEVGQHHHRFHTPGVRSMHARLRPTISPRPLGQLRSSKRRHVSVTFHSRYHA